MASFDTSGKGLRTPFGRNEWRRSTEDEKTESYTCSAAATPAETIDGDATQKVLQPGEVLAKITSGPEAGKVGPFQAGVADGRQTAANIVGINGTFLPWQLTQRDVEVAAFWDCSPVQAWCFERDASGARIPLSNATRDAIIANVSTRLIRFS
jgi:hypothetical protein